MKVQVSKEWIDSNDQFLFIINAVPKDNPGKLQTQGKGGLKIQMRQI